MATKTIVTRIKNKVDTLAAWQSYTGTLLNGEIAVVRVPTGTSYTNPITGKSEPVVELLMKVGDGSTSFANLPWMSAKASDVYDWAKAATVEFNTTDNKIYFKQANGTSIANIDLSSLASKISALESKKITVTPNDSSKPGVVQSVTQGDATNEIDVTYGLIQTADIDAKQVTAAKIADSTITATQLANGAVTNGKIADSAVTNAKLGSDISSDKINVGTGNTAGTLSKKLAEYDAALAGIKSNISVVPTNEGTGVVQSVTYNNATGEIAVAYGAVATGDIASSAVTTAKIADANVTTAKIKDGNVTNAKIASGVSSDKITVKNTSDNLTTKLSNLDAAISSLNETLAKGIIFRGEVASAPSGTTYTLKDTSTAITAIVGDMVLCGEKEYIYTADSTWKELGDLSRVTTLETWRNKLQKSDTAVTSKFVTEVDIAADGTVTINRAQPTSADVKHGTNSTVSAKLDEIDAALANKSDKDHTHSSYVNQNAFSNIKVTKSGGGSSDVTVAADTTTDTVTFTGTNVTITGTASSDTINFSVAKADAAGETGIVTLSDSATTDSSATAATSKAVKAVYDKADTIASNLAAHGHGNIGNGGTLATANAVVVTDENKKIVASTTITTTELAQLDGINTNETIQAQLNKKGTSNLTIGTTSTTAAAGNHNHNSTYASKTDFAAVSANYVRFNTADSKLYVGATGTDDIIFDCGGAE